MSNKDIFAERGRGLEEEYFMRKERELIEKLHQKLSSESAQQQIAFTPLLSTHNDGPIHLV